MDVPNIFCTIVFGDIQYVVAAVAAVKSYHDVGGKLPFWCLYSDIEQDYVDLLSRYFDNVVEVPILSRDMPGFQSQRKSDMYGRWINRSFTRFNCFDPNIISRDQASLVCMMDADILFMKNPDSIFDDIKPNSQGIMPIGIVCDTPYIMQYKIKQPFVCHDKGGVRKYKHGEFVAPSQISECTKSWKGVPGYVIIFSPNKTHWANFNNFFNTFPPINGLLGYDEQLLGRIVDTHKVVVNISPGYAWHVGKTKWYSGEVWCQHYVAGHPWLMESGSYPDVTAWWAVWNKLTLESQCAAQLNDLIKTVRDKNNDVIKFNAKTREQLLVDGKIGDDGKVI